MSLFHEVQKQPRHVREIMFGLCVVSAISLIGMIWFRSFEEDLFVLLNTGEKEQQRFYAEREQRTPTIYANVTEALGEMRATIYGAMGFFDDYTSQKPVEVEGDYQGEARKLPLSGDK